jgi:large subunit ribosomal protein L21
MEEWELGVDSGVPTPLESSFVSIEEDLSMYAVIRTGGKQYRVTPGQTIRLESLAGEPGSKVQLGEVLLVENDGKFQAGAPLLTNAKVEATVLEHDRAKKIIVFKKKRKKQYRRTNGHRQNFTAVRIESITL